MTRIYFDGRDLEIVIRYDGIARVYPLASLAAALRLPTAVLRARIDALLKAGDDLSTGDLAYGPSRESSSCSIKMEEEPTEMDPEAITRTLGDDANVTAITSLVADVPVALVRAALDQALSVPGYQLRSHRAALFTAIVRRLVREHAHASSSPYARTETPTT